MNMMWAGNICSSYLQAGKTEGEGLGIKCLYKAFSLSESEKEIIMKHFYHIEDG